MTHSVRRPSSALPGSLQWYVAKVHSGQEESVKAALERRAKLESFEESIGRILIPVEKVVELRNGRRVERARKLFPGYLLCELTLDESMLALFQEIPGFADFIGSGSTPVPLSSIEVERMVGWQSRKTGPEVPPTLLPEFARGDPVRVLRGAFAQMEGEVAEVLPATGQVRVCVTIIGRPVLLDLEPIEVLRLR